MPESMGPTNTVAGRYIVLKTKNSMSKTTSRDVEIDLKRQGRRVYIKAGVIWVGARANGRTHFSKAGL